MAEVFREVFIFNPDGTKRFIGAKQRGGIDLQDVLMFGMTKENNKLIVLEVQDVDPINKLGPHQRA